MKKTIFTLLSLLLLFFSNITLAQYTKNDSSLVRTTFLREFDKSIITEYLQSDNPTKINAALLSISHSADTTFIDSIIKLDYNKYGDYISFALGQLGESKKSTEYLFKFLQIYNFHFNSETYYALGNCGDSTTLDILFGLIDDNLFNSSAGFPLAITNFYSRGIKDDNSFSYIINNLHKNDNQHFSWPNSDNLLKNKRFKWNLSDIRLKILELQKEFNTFYALYRIGSSKEAIPELRKLVNDDFYKQTKLYVLGNFRKLQYFPYDIELLKKLIASDSWRIKTETANSACFYPFESKEEISLYLSLLDDKSPNVSRTAATALKNIKYSENPTWLRTKIEKFIVAELVDATENTKGELLISYASLFNIDVQKIIDDFAYFVESKFIYRLLATNTSDWEFNFNYLNDRIEESTEIELLDLLPAYLALQDKFVNSKEYVSHLFKVFQSNKPSSVSIIADGLKTPIINRHNKILQQLILEQVFKNKNNPQFAETIVSLANLSQKVGGSFYDSIIDMLSTSTLNSIKKYAFDKQGIEFNPQRDDKLFAKLWSNSFKYKFAEVETNKGTFTIKLKPEYAPMTCGNFITLTESGFYNGVVFHRVVPNFVIQTGDTSNTGWGGPGYEIVSEFSPLPFDRAAVGVASIGKDTEGSQWFVMHSIFPHLNGRYTNWATVIDGMNVVDIIDEGDRVLKVKLF